MSGARPPGPDSTSSLPTISRRSVGPSPGCRAGREPVRALSGGAAFALQVGRLALAAARLPIRADLLRLRPRGNPPPWGPARLLARAASPATLQPPAAWRIRSGPVTHGKTDVHRGRPVAGHPLSLGDPLRSQAPAPQARGGGPGERGPDCARGCLPGRSRRLPP